MSVIAWDGKTIAADRQMTSGDMGVTCCKLVRLPSRAIVGWTGTAECGLVLLDWLNGKREWPKFQEDKERWTRLVMVDDKGVWFYEQEPVPIQVLDKFMAWGSGRDFAMGALAMGATAERAVEIANQFCVTCGMGVDVFEILA